MIKYCFTHKAQMPEKISKTKKNPDGSYKVYNAHTDVMGKMCFGVGDPPKEDKKEWVEENIEASKEMVEDVKAEQEAEEEDEGPMKKSEWRKKDDQIRRLTLAKQFIGAGIDFDNAKKNNDLFKWDDWTKTGNRSEE